MFHLDHVGISKEINRQSQKNTLQKNNMQKKIRSQQFQQTCLPLHFKVTLSGSSLFQKNMIKRSTLWFFTPFPPFDVPTSSPVPGSKGRQPGCGHWLISKLFAATVKSSGACTNFPSPAKVASQATSGTRSRIFNPEVESCHVLKNIKNVSTWKRLVLTSSQKCKKCSKKFNALSNTLLQFFNAKVPVGKSGRLKFSGEKMKAGAAYDESTL